MKTAMTIRTDIAVKEQAKRLFDNLGLDLSTAINLFLRQAIRQQGLPFKVTLNNFKMETIKALEDKNMNGPFDSVDALMRSLDA